MLIISVWSPEKKFEKICSHKISLLYPQRVGWTAMFLQYPRKDKPNTDSKHGLLRFSHFSEATLGEDEARGI